MSNQLLEIFNVFAWLEYSYTFFLGVLASLLATILWEKFSGRFPNFSKSNAPSIAGFWIAKVPLNHFKNKKAFDIYRIKERKGKVKMYGEHYNDSFGSTLKFIGTGIFISPFMSCVYHYTDPSDNHSGTLTLALNQTHDGKIILNGSYTEFIDNENDFSMSPVSESYTMIKINIPFLIQLRVFWGLNYFTCLETVENLYGSLFKKDPLNSSTP